MGRGLLSPHRAELPLSTGCPASGLSTRPWGQAGPSAMLWFPPAAVSLRGCKWKSGVWPGSRTRAPAARRHTALACSAACWGCHPGSGCPLGWWGDGDGFCTLGTQPHGTQGPGAKVLHRAWVCRPGAPGFAPGPGEEPGCEWFPSPAWRPWSLRFEGPCREGNDSTQLPPAPLPP